MFQDLKSLLPRVIKKSGIYKQVEANKIIEIFNEFAAQTLPGHAADKIKAAYLRNKVLHIASLSGIISNEIKFKESDIIRYINKRIGSEAVVKLKFIA